MLKSLFHVKFSVIFWNSLYLPSINCETKLVLSWTKACALSEHHHDIAGAIFQIKNMKLYVPVVILSINDNIKFLENIKQGFKRKISWSKYRSEITVEPKNNNLDYLIHPQFKILLDCLFFRSKILMMILQV